MSGTAHIKQTRTTLPEGFFGISSCAQILVSPDGRFVYASNRGDDSIAVLRGPRRWHPQPARAYPDRWQGTAQLRHRPRPATGSWPPTRTPTPSSRSSGTRESGTARGHRHRDPVRDAGLRGVCRGIEQGWTGSTGFRVPDLRPLAPFQWGKGLLVSVGWRLSSYEVTATPSVLVASSASETKVSGSIESQYANPSSRSTLQWFQ